jgi:hypothetical protein
MFDGIKLLCLGVIDENNIMAECLNPIIVPENRYLKIANLKYRCPNCSHQSDKMRPYFIALMNLDKRMNELMAHGFYCHHYAIGIHGCHDDMKDDFDLTPYALEHNDWGNWNMQIAMVNIANLENSGYRIDLWEDHFLKAQPILQYSMRNITFEKILRRKRPFYIDSHIVNLEALKDAVKAIRNYNSALLALVDSGVAAAPVDIKHSLYTNLNQVDSLIDLFPEAERYE